MKRLFICFLFLPIAAFCQFTPYGIGIIQQPNPPAAQSYLQVTNVEPGTNVVLSPGSRAGRVKVNVPAVPGAGTVTTVSAGNFSPLFNTSIANPATTPALSFAAINQSANMFFLGPASGGAAAPTFRAALPADLGAFTNHSDVIPVSLAKGDILAWSGTAWTNGQPGTAAGTVTSVSSGNFSPLFNVTVATATTTPAFSFAAINQSPNLVFSGPSSGGAVAPTFRSLVANDIPSLTLSKISDAGTVAAINLDGNAAHFLDGSGAFSTPGGGGTSLPGLLTRPVRATSDGALSAPTFPDDDTYYFDEEFDSWIGNGNGQFSKNNFTPVSVTTGGAVNNVSSNRPPYFGLIDLQGPTTGNNSFWIIQYGSTGIMPYFALANQSNWLFHAVFNMGATNTGSYVRIGLVDQTYNASIGAGLEPSNCVSLRFSIKESDGNHFWFESRSNGTTVSVQSSIVVATNQFYKVTMLCTNGPGIVLFSINGESWQKLTNTPMQGMSIAAAVGTITSTSQHIWVDRLSFMAASLGR